MSLSYNKTNNKVYSSPLFHLPDLMHIIADRKVRRF